MGMEIPTLKAQVRQGALQEVGFSADLGFLGRNFKS